MSRLLKPLRFATTPNQVNQRYQNLWRGLQITVPFMEVGDFCPINTRNGTLLMGNNGAGTQTVGAYGPAVTHGGGGYSIDTGWNDLPSVTTSPVTIFAVVEHKFSFYGFRGIVFMGNGADTDSIYLGFDSATYNAKFVVNGTEIASGSNTVPEGSIYAVAGVNDGATSTLYINGIQAATGAAARSANADHTYFRVSKDVFGGSQTWDSLFYVIYMWDRALTADEVKLLTDDPYGIIRAEYEVFDAATVLGTLYTQTVNNISRGIDLLTNTKQLYTTVQNTATANAVVTTGWTNAANGYTSNNVYATAAPANNATISSDYSGFGFNIPTNATVQSVTIEAEYKVSTTASVATFGMQAYVGGSAVGTEYVDNAEPTADTIRSSVVSASFTPANLSDANFKVRVRATRTGSATAVTFSLDMVRVTVTYTVPQASLIVRAINELLGSNESRNFARAKIIAETISILETRLKKIFSNRNETATATQTDIARISKSLANSVTLTQTLNAVRQLVRTLNNTFTMTETRIKQAIKFISNPVTTTETRVKRDSKSLTDVVSASESRIKRGIKSLANTFTITESRVNQAIKSIANSVTLTETRSRLQGRSIANVVTVTESRIKKAIKSIANSVTLIETRNRLFARSIANSLSIAQAQLKQVAKSIANSVTTSETRIKKVSKSLANAVTLIETRIKKVSKVLANALTFIATLDTQKLSGTILYTINNTVSTIQTLVKKVNITRAESLTVTQLLTKRISKSLADISTLAQNLIKRVQVTKANTVTVNQVQIKSISKSIANVVSVVESRTKRISKILGNALSIAVGFSGDILAGMKFATINVAVSITQSITKRVSSTQGNIVTLAQSIGKRISISRANTITITQSTRKTISIYRGNIITIGTVVGKSARKIMQDAIIVTHGIIKFPRVTFTETLSITTILSRLFTYTVNSLVTTSLAVQEIKNIFVVQALRVSRTVREYSRSTTTRILKTAQRVYDLVQKSRTRDWNNNSDIEDWK